MYKELPLLSKGATKRIIPRLINWQHATMPQIRGPLALIGGTPRPALDIRALIRRIAAAAKEIQQQVRLAIDLVIPVRGGALDTLLDNRARATRPRPGAKQAVRRDLGEDVRRGLVLDEAGVRVVAEGQEGQVDHAARAVVDVVGGRGEGLEVAGVGAADLDGRGAAGVARVGGGVELAGPVHQVLPLLLVPQRLGRPHHAGRLVLDDDEPLARPGY